MRKFIVITALVALSATAVAREEKSVFKWTDENGVVHYGDSIPPEYRDLPKERLNDQGVAVELLEGKKTEEQLEQERLAEERRVARSCRSVPIAHCSQPIFRSTRSSCTAIAAWSFFRHSRV